VITSSAIALRRWFGSTAVLLGLCFLNGCPGCADELPSEQPHDAAAGGHGGSSSTSSTSSSSGGGGGTKPAPFEGWEALAGVPAYCEVYAASEPETLAPLSWLDCSDGAPGCRELEINWDAPASPYLFYPGPLTGAATPSGLVLVIDRRLGGELADWRELLVARIDGPVLSALRSRDPINTVEPCSAAYPAIGGGRVVAGLIDWTLDDPALREHELEVPLTGGVPTVFSTLSEETLHGNFGSNRSPGTEFMAMAYSPAAQVLIVPYDGSAPTVFAKFSMQNPWGPNHPVAVGPDVLFWADHADRTREHVYHSLTGVTETFIEVSGADVGPVMTDDQKLVWLQVSPPKAQGSPTSVELWSSPVATTPAGLVPQKEADLAPSLWNDEAHFESDLVVLRDVSWSRNYVLRLADLVYWTLDAPAGMSWGKTLYAAADEVAMPVQPPAKQSETTTIRRLALAELGAPQPLSGPLGE